MSAQTIKNFQLNLDNFSGPLDLLLSLIEAKKMPISDISLARVTDDFLSFLGDIKAASPGIIADFLSVASKLLLIKSRELLPDLTFSGEEEEEIKDFARQLEVYRQFKNLSKNIKNLYLKNRLFSREFLENRRPVFFPPSKISAVDLGKLFASVWEEFEKIEEKSEVEKVAKIVKIEEKIKDILALLSQAISLSFNKISEKKSRSEIIVSFLAILQMFKDQHLNIEQEDVFGEIRIVRK